MLDGKVGGIAGVLEILIGPLEFAAVERLCLAAAGGGLIGSSSLPAEANLAISRGGLGVGRPLLATRRIGAIASLSRDPPFGVTTGLPRLLTIIRLAPLALALLRLAFSAFAFTLLPLALTLLTLTLLTLTLLTLTLLTLTLLTLTLLTLTLLTLTLLALALTRLPAAA